MIYIYSFFLYVGMISFGRGGFALCVVLIARQISGFFLTVYNIMKTRLELNQESDLGTSGLYFVEELFSVQNRVIRDE